MAAARQSSDVILDVNAGRSDAHPAAGHDMPFRLLLMGDFSGRASRRVVESGAALASRRIVRVDRDDIERALKLLVRERFIATRGRDGIQRDPLAQLHRCVVVRSADENERHPKCVAGSASRTRMTRANPSRATYAARRPAQPAACRSTTYPP